MRKSSLRGRARRRGAAAGARRPCGRVRRALQAGRQRRGRPAAIRDAGGTIVSENTDVGVATVSSSDPASSKGRGEAALDGAARNRVIGHVPGASSKPSWRDVESEQGQLPRHGPRPKPVNGDPLGGLQWDMQLIGATPTGSYAHDQGSHDVRVGIMDTGVDGKHPGHRAELRPLPEPQLHGRQLRAGHRRRAVRASDLRRPRRRGRRRPRHARRQHGRLAAQRHRRGRRRPGGRPRQHPRRPGPGFFLLQPRSTRSPTPATDGIDVVNMSFFIDPWLFNCRANPAD